MRDPEEFPAWLATIARNRARDAARKWRTVSLTDELNEAPDPSDHRTASGSDDVAHEVHAALATLPDAHRVALTVRYFDSLDYATIEQTLGLTNGALRGMLGRALQTMRKRLQPALASLNQ
ncbi:MAG: RNA polymerase sigma factor [Chthoniobacterales bacterium]